MNRIARVLVKSLRVAVFMLLPAVLAAPPFAVDARADGPRQAVSGRTAPAEAARSEVSPWSLQVRGGLLTSGDIFRLNTEISRMWTPPAGGEPFSSDKFKVTLDENAMFGLAVGYDLNPDLRLRFGADFATLDATALARIGQSVYPLLYDEITFTAYSLDLEADLMRTRHHPYLIAGLVLCSVDGKGETLDQTRGGFKLGVGFEADIAPNWALKVEAVDTMIQIDTDEHRDSLGEDILFSELGPQNLFGFTGGLLVRF